MESRINGLLKSIGKIPYLILSTGIGKHKRLLEFGGVRDTKSQEKDEKSAMTANIVNSAIALLTYYFPLLGILISISKKGGN
jgi:hypothetical protein